MISRTPLALIPALFVVATACHQASSTPAEPAAAPATTTEVSAPSASAAPAEPVAEPPAPPPSGTAPGGASAPAPSAPSSAPAPAASATAAAPAPATSAEPTKKAPAAQAGAHAEAPKSAAPAAGGYTGPDACETKNFHYSVIASACHTGGRKAAKDVMKGIVKKARVSGADLTCTSCHQDTTTFHLKPNAVGDLKSWL